MYKVQSLSQDLRVMKKKRRKKKKWFLSSDFVPSPILHI